MATLHEQFFDGTVFFAGASGANTGVSGLNDITSEVNRHTSFFQTGSATGITNGIGLKRAFLEIGNTGSGTGAFDDLVSGVFAPVSSTNIIFAAKFVGSGWSDGANGGGRIRIVPSDGGGTYLSQHVDTLDNMPLNIPSGTSVTPRVVTMPIGTTANAQVAASGGIFFGMAGAGSYVVTLQGATSSGYVGFSGGRLELYYMDNGTSGATITQP